MGVFQHLQNKQVLCNCPKTVFGCFIFAGLKGAGSQF